VSRRGQRLLTCALLLALAGASALAARGGGPFYFAPSPTKECQGLTNCTATTGPWVVVPAHGEATFLIGCPDLFGYLVGGTDARASSSAIHVWFEGNLGAPIGRTSRQGALLLFLALSENGQPGSFQPILGCVELQQKNKVSTVSLVRVAGVPGTTPGAPLDYRARLVLVRPFKGLGYKQRGGRAARCPAAETLVGSWGAVAFETSSPPSVADINSITLTTTVTGKAVHAVVQRTSTSALPPPAEIQYGAMCQS
jgi:hypothetical protein